MIKSTAVWKYSYSARVSLRIQWKAWNSACWGQEHKEKDAWSDGRVNSSMQPKKVQTSMRDKPTWQCMTHLDDLQQLWIWGVNRKEWGMAGRGLQRHTGLALELGQHGSLKKNDPIGSGIWVLGPRLWTCLGRMRKRDSVGGVCHSKCPCHFQSLPLSASCL